MMEKYQGEDEEFLQGYIVLEGPERHSWTVSKTRTHESGMDVDTVIVGQPVAAG